MILQFIPLVLYDLGLIIFIFLGDDLQEDVMELYQILEDTEAVSELEDFRPFQSRDHMLLYLLVHGTRKFVSDIKVMVWLSYTKYFYGPYAQ